MNPRNPKKKGEVRVTHSFDSFDSLDSSNSLDSL